MSPSRTEPHLPGEFPHPQLKPHGDEATALARANRSPGAARVAMFLALAAVALLWFRSASPTPALIVAVAAVAVSAVAWRQARRRRLPSGVAVAALAVGFVTLAIGLLLWL
jgi:hypothetical protein